jgi:hypothetical protein
MTGQFMTQCRKAVFQCRGWACIGAKALATACLLGASAGAQQKIFIVNPPPASAPVKAVEAEQVEIHRLFAIPNQIHRSKGPFLLFVDNETGDRSAEFVLDPGDAGDGVLSPSRVLLYDRKALRVKHRAAGFLDLDKGTYHLKSADKRHILCTITIE